jgi:inositol monophosphatase 3
MVLFVTGYKTVEVIQGNAEAYVHVTDIKKWDICAGHAILRAVDGKMTTLEGNYITYFPKDDPRNRDGLLATIYHHDDYLAKLAPEMETLKKKEHHKR